MRKRTYPDLGSISSGTMRPQDLLSAFAPYCQEFGGKDGRKLAREYNQLPAWGDMTEDQQGEAGYILDEMFDCLQNAAPDFVTFGAHEGDGADYGFWPDIDALEDAVRSKEAIKVNDTGDIPKGYIGHVMDVNDHGNVTLYWRSARKLTELWSCV